MAPLTVVQKVNYSWGDMAEATVSIALGQFLLFYLTAVVGMSGSLAGTALALTLEWSTRSSIRWSAISATTSARAGAAAIPSCSWPPSIPMAVSMGLLFSVPKMASETSLFFYVFAVLLLLRFSYSVFVLPYIALGAELSRDYTTRPIRAPGLSQLLSTSAATS